MSQEQLKNEMIDEAVKRYGDISYCGNKTNWNDCFTEEEGYLMFWFNVGKDTKTIRYPS